MKIKNMHRGCMLILLSLICLCGTAQDNRLQLQQYISDHGNDQAITIKTFYEKFLYRPIWLQKENKNNLDILLKAFKQSPYIGLRQNDYEVKLAEALNEGSAGLKNSVDTLDAEVRLTISAIHYYNDIAYGNDKPAFGYNGIRYPTTCKDIPALLAEYILNGKLDLLMNDVSPSLSEITAVQNRISRMYKIISDPGFKEVHITSNKAELANKPLADKLSQLGIINSPKELSNTEMLKEKVREAQRQFNLIADGILRSTIIHELNIPLATRLKELNSCINYYRWLSCVVKGQSVILVNIPAANLKVYQHDNIILEMKIVVGKRSTPTPTLTSRISEVILYPYWHVPYSIATKELLPLIKRNPGYINQANYQVLNKAGNIVNPYSVNWKKYNTKYFPFLIRQSTGCDNALGLLKLNFYSPYGVYLHDTPGKFSFTLNKRYLSHGCMRMEKPMELGHLVLKNNPLAIDSLEQKGCLRNQSPITVPADDKMAVIVWYNPVGTDNTGRVLFYEDVYEKF